MENYVYEKEYLFPEDIDEREGDEADAIREYLRAHPIRQEKAAHAVLPFGPRLFEKTVADCETIAEAFCGKLRAVIDYTKFTASIDLWFCYAAFRRGEYMDLLQAVIFRTISVELEALPSRDLRVHLELPYFIPFSGMEESN